MSDQRDNRPPGQGSDPENDPPDESDAPPPKLPDWASRPDPSADPTGSIDDPTRQYQPPPQPPVAPPPESSAPNAPPPAWGAQSIGSPLPPSGSTAPPAATTPPGGYNQPANNPWPAPTPPGQYPPPAAAPPGPTGTAPAAGFGPPAGQPPFGGPPPGGYAPGGYAPGPPSYGAPGYGPPPSGPSGPSNGIATAALVTGILAVLTSCLFVLGVAAVVLGAIGMSKAKQLGGLKRGQALAGLILGVISLVIGGAIVAALIAGGTWLEDAADDLAGSADTDTYDIAVDECSVTDSGAVTAIGTLTNTSDDSRNFEIEVSFLLDGDEVDQGSEVIFDLPADSDDTWEVSGSVDGDGEVRCTVHSVNNLFN